MYRAFFLDEDYPPEPSFIEWSGNAILTYEDPEAVIWKRTR
jgi:hypothetical protein